MQSNFTTGSRKTYTGGWVFPVGEAKVVPLQQVDMVAHLCKKFLGFSMFLHKNERETDKQGEGDYLDNNPI